MNNILGVIFCGGQGLRLGGVSKMDIRLGGQSLLKHAAAHLRSHVKDIALSVKVDTSLPDAHGFKIIHDLQDTTEKLSVAIALVSALRFAKDNGYDAILTLPVDTPFLPSDYATLMIESAQPVDCVYAEHDGHIHGLHSLWKTSAYDGLKKQVITDKNYRISSLYKETLSTACSFTDVDKAVFLNINTPENLELAQQIIATP